MMIRNVLGLALVLALAAPMTAAAVPPPPPGPNVRTYDVDELLKTPPAALAALLIGKTSFEVVDGAPSPEYEFYLEKLDFFGRSEPAPIASLCQRKMQTVELAKGYGVQKVYIYATLREEMLYHVRPAGGDCAGLKRRDGFLRATSAEVAQYSIDLLPRVLKTARDGRSRKLFTCQDCRKNPVPLVLATEKMPLVSARSTTYGELNLSLGDVGSDKGLWNLDVSVDKDDRIKAVKIDRYPPYM